MSRLIPPIGTRGLYTLKAPWSVAPGVLYTCAAIRKFIDLENLGTDVFVTYYEPYGLDRTVYEQDRRNDEVLLTLVSETTAPLYVPSSYLASFPDQSHRNYQHVVLSASLGPLPDYIDLSFAQDQVASVISDVIGMAPTVHLSLAPSTGVVTPEQHDALEAARMAAVANRTTDRARVLELTRVNQELSQRLAILEKIVKDYGLIPT